MAEKTAYVVLKQTNATGTTPTFQIVAPSVQGHSADDAIKSYVEAIPKELLLNDEKESATTYVAVPQRSWRPQPVTIDTQTVVKVGG